MDIEKTRKDFPILSTLVNGKPLVYLDNAATSQKPQQVIDVITNYYTKQNSNIHRGVHYLSQCATEAFEDSREKIRAFINAPQAKQIIFTKGTTDAINLIATGYGRKFIGKGDQVIISAMEHHSNIVPWQMLCEEKQASLKIIPINEKGEIIFEAFEKMLNPKVKLISICHVSNALGTINPVKEIIQKAHEFNIPVVIDGAQAVHFMKVDVQELDCDFYAFSGHKMFGPTGIGILYGKEALLNEMNPYQGGGDMIKTVSFEKTIYNEIPHKFEAGTPNIEAGIALGAAIDYINSIGIENIHAQEKELLEYATKKLTAIEGLQIIGRAKEKSGVISFIVNGLHPYDIGVILDKLGIAIRTGHHCTQPLMERLNLPGTARASFAFYNTINEVDTLVKGIEKAIQMLK
ncbi:MAG: cysteine desulfurase [Bacteroidetes bacterium]|nr:cysteine desulfurase [Bacteroidota bacterium]